jgi:enoyl-CoA hydratase/carnithine racemase
MPVDYVVNNHIATITLDRPAALNAIDLELWEGFGRATEQLAADDDAWVGIVTGAGDRAFCAGADIKTTIRAMLDDPRSKKFDHPSTVMRGQVLDKPLIAAVNGVALGGGLEVVLSCDIRIASKTARFGSPEVRLGVIPGWGATQRLPRMIPWAIAAQMILDGEPIDADRALACGLVNAVVEPGEVMAEALRAAERLCARGPLALRAAKRAMNAALNLPLEEGLAAEKDLFESLAYTEDVREGISAFEEKRTAQFNAR